MAIQPRPACSDATTYAPFCSTPSIQHGAAATSSSSSNPGLNVKAPPIQAKAARPPFKTMGSISGNNPPGVAPSALERRKSEKRVKDELDQSSESSGSNVTKEENNRNNDSSDQQQKTPLLSSKA